MPAIDRKITITLSDVPHVRLVEADWPIVANAEWFDGEHECQANYIRFVRVRQHADGRRVVYGTYSAGPGGAPSGFRGIRAGYLLSDSHSEDTIRAIRRVAAQVEDVLLGAECIGDLPAEEI